MSLFGSSPDDSSLQDSHAKKEHTSLFDDEQAPGAKSHASLFDDNGDNTDSPWSMPTPKKAGRNDLVKSLLPNTAVPESYINAFDTLLESDYKTQSGTISAGGAKRLLEEAKLEKSEQERILKLISSGQDLTHGLGRNEANVLFALIGLSQEKEEATLDGVDERRSHLPEPSLPLFSQVKSSKASEDPGEDSPQSEEIPTSPKHETLRDSPSKSRRLRKDSLENIDADPWASPALHKGHTHTVENDATPSSNGPTAVRPLTNGASGATRTTSTFTTHSNDQSSIPSDHQTSASLNAADSGAGGWSSYERPSGGFGNIGQAQISPVGFGSRGDDSNQQPGAAARRSLGDGRTTNRGVEEIVTVTLLPEKEVNGRHLSSDVTFIEKRRRGLVRFVNALVKHPVLSQEQLVVMFLTVPTELAVWRKQATISVQEEFTGKPLPPNLEDSLPTNLSETFDTVRSGVRQSAEAYIGLCTLLERMNKRNQGVAADHLRFSRALSALTESSESTYAVDTNDVPLLNEGINSTAKHLALCQSLLEDEARAWDEGMLEDLKKQRDTLVGLRDMFDRRDRYAKDNIPQLERRIQSNEMKLAGLVGRPEGVPVKAGEQEKLEQAVRADKQSIVDQHARGVFIKECIRDELLYFQQSQYHVSRLHQDWSQERVKYAELQAHNWRALSEEVENMPTGD